MCVCIYTLEFRGFLQLSASVFCISRGQRLKVTGLVLWCLISSDRSSQQFCIPSQHDAAQPTEASRAVSFALLYQNTALFVEHFLSDGYYDGLFLFMYFENQSANIVFVYQVWWKLERWHSKYFLFYFTLHFQKVKVILTEINFCQYDKSINNQNFVN